MANKTINMTYRNSGLPLLSNPLPALTLLEDLNNRLVGDGYSALSNSFTFEFNVFLETTRTEGDLVYVFKPFRNMLVGKEIVDFSTTALNFSINNPVDIEVQPSYDGTVNLILSDNLNPPRLINSRFSVTEGKRYYIVDRYGNKDSNLYKDTEIEVQTRLYKTINKIPSLEFLGLKQDGNLMVGNYVFYFKLVDADDNETDIITESGVVSCHVGNINDVTTIRGGVGNENSGKSVTFRFTNLDTNYAYLNVYYSRSTSDYSKQELTSYHAITTKFSVTPEVFEFRITGYEPTQVITKDKINVSYNMIDRNKSATQVQSMLFMANIHKTTNPYQELTDLSFRILPYAEQVEGLNIGYLDSNYSAIDPGKCAYYDSKNVYNFTGYWDDELYRLAIVYIMNDFSLSAPYNIRGRDFSKFSGDSDYGSLETFPLYNGQERVYITDPDDGFLPVRDNKDILENLRGVIRIKLNDKGQIEQKRISPISFRIQIHEDVQAELAKYTKGFFIVRQKRIPTIISQGFSIGHDPISGLPLIPEYSGFQTNHIIQGTTLYPAGYTGVTTSYDSIDKALTAASGKYRLPAKGETYFTFVKDSNLAHNTDLKKRVRRGGAMLVPDLLLNSEELSVIFSGSEFTITSANHSPNYQGFSRHITNTFPSNKSMEELDKLATHFLIDDYTLNAEYKSEVVTLLHVPEDTTLISHSDKYFSSRAGIAEEPWRFSAFLKEEIGLVTSGNSPFSYNDVDYYYDQNVLIRGIFMSYLGMIPKETSTSVDSAKFYNIRTMGFNEASMKDYFMVRANDTAPFMAISDRYSWDVFSELPLVNENRNINVFRGDCFINQVSIRVLRNFQDPEVPTNDVIIDYKTLENFAGYANSGGILELSGATATDKTNGTGVYKINRGDVNAARLGYWTTFKFCSNVNFAFRCIDPTYTTEYATFGRPRSFYPLYDRNLAGNSKIPESTVMNVGYNSTTSDKEHYIVYNVPAIKNDFTNRIMFSEIHVTDAFKNGYRVFQGLDYKDYTIEYGTITKIISWRNNLIVVFESGVGLIPINERTLAGQSEGESIYLRGAGVLAEKPLMLSTGIGSTWKDSIKMSQNYIYGVDTNAKKIWRTEGTKFDIFSEFRVQKFLNDNLDLTVYDRTPTMGLKNVVTHFNAHKHDLMFTFYDQTFNESEKIWNLCFNEQLNNWTTKYTWMPSLSENLDNTMFSFSRGTCKVTSMISKSISGADGLGSIYIDSTAEEPLTANDYLALMYERQIEDSFTSYPISTYTLSATDNIGIPTKKSVEFLDDSIVGKHPMYHGNTWNNGGYNKITTIAPATGDVLLVYDIDDSPLRIASISVLSFYRSADTTLNISAGDELICNKYDGDSINNSVLTTTSKPNLKVQFIVDPTTTEEEANLLTKDGWSFNIISLPSDTVVIDTVEYLLTLQGKEKYKNSSFNYSLPYTTNPIYDNTYFKVFNSSNSVMSINSKALSTYTAEDKYQELLKVFSRIYFSLLVDLKVIFNNSTSVNGLTGMDQFRDVLYVRPNITALTDLVNIFTYGPYPPLKPASGSTPEVAFTEVQRATIVAVLQKTIDRYNANITTNLWQHGNTNIFGTTTTLLPATWYGETHPFEFEFVVNGDELGLHKLFDNLKIISNKAQPDSFEFEIVGDSYNFTDDAMLTSVLNGLSDEEYKETYIKEGYTLLPPAYVNIDNKTKERRILLIQEAKDIKTQGLRKGNMQYKEDMWEVQISTLKVSNAAGKISESKLRDKYCRIRVKYSGDQLAIITALQTLYTLSYS